MALARLVCSSETIGCRTARIECLGPVEYSVLLHVGVFNADAMRCGFYNCPGEKF